MFDAAIPAAEHASQAFARHPDNPGSVILVVEGQRGFQPIHTRLDPSELNHLLVKPTPSEQEVDAMLDYALDQPELTDIVVTQGWPA